MKRLAIFVAGFGLALLLGLNSGCSDARAQTSFPAVYRPQAMQEITLALNGSPVPLGDIIADAGGTPGVNNCTGNGTAFNCASPGLSGMVLLAYAQGQGRVLPVTTNSGYATSVAGDADAGVPLSTGERVIIAMCDTCGWLSWNSDGGVGLEVWRLR